MAVSCEGRILIHNRANYRHATKFEGIDHTSHPGAGATPHVVTTVSLSITVAFDRSKTQF